MSDDFDVRMLDALRSADRARPMAPEARDRARTRALAAFDRAVEEGEYEDSGSIGELLTLDHLDEVDCGDPRRPRLLLAAAAFLVVAVVGVAAWLGTTDADDGTEVDVADRLLDPDFVLGQQDGDAVLASEVEEWCGTSDSVGVLREAVAEWRSSPATVAVTEDLLVVVAETATGYGDVLLASASPIGPQRLNELANYGGRIAIVEQRLASADVAPVADVQTLLDEFDAEFDAVTGDTASCEFLG